MLHWRLISAALILTVLLTLLWLDWRLIVFGTPGAWLLPLLVLVSLVATSEVLSLVQAQGHQPIAWLVYLGNALIPISATMPQMIAYPYQTLDGRFHGDVFAWPIIVLAASFVAVMVAEMARYDRPGAAIMNAALATFCLVYVGLLISFWALLRLQHDNNYGMVALFSTLLIVKWADTGAFAVGKALGQHKLTPTLSPGKTWEGATGGIAAACLTSWLFFHYGAGLMIGSAYVEPPLPAVLAYGALLALAGMAGDLAESLLKRDMQCKDSSTWLPGLGGVLDIIDAVLFAGPVAWLCWTFGLVGP